MKAVKTEKPDNPVKEVKKKEMTLEEAFSKLESTVRKLEGQDISLEDSFVTYKEGMEILKMCNDKIDQVEKKVLVIDESGNLNEF